MYTYIRILLPSSPNIRNFDILFTLFDHSSYLENLCKYI
jgi:hypothetical protein